MTHSLNKPNRYLLPLSAFMLIAFNHAALGQQPPVVVKTFGQHYGGNIVYHQQVTNNGSRDVVGIAFGLDTDETSPNLPETRLQGELNIVMPVGLKSLDQGINPASISGPVGWTAEIIQIEHTGRYLQWDSPGHPQPSIQSGQTFRFSITVPKYFQAYLTGHFSAGYADGKDPWYYNGVMEKLDTTPPGLTVSLTPAKLWPPDGRQIPVTATIKAKDDYDPAPEIKLESITATETLAANDIQNARIGTDDRGFSLAAKRAGTGLAGAVYTVTYSATDASGNKATASATVAVRPKYPTTPTVPLERLDTTPPALTVSLTPAKLWPPDGRQVPVTATIKAKDDYDPQPEIKLESITATETLAANDIRNARIGTDDRSFSLAAKRARTNPAGVIYTVTYSATDASGNKATASATATARPGAR